jgi:hypothetical protein
LKPIEFVEERKYMESQKGGIEILQLAGLMDNNLGYNGWRVPLCNATGLTPNERVSHMSGANTLQFEYKNFSSIKRLVSGLTKNNYFK